MDMDLMQVMDMDPRMAEDMAAIMEGMEVTDMEVITITIEDSNT